MLMSWHNRYTVTILSDVKFISTYANGIDITHIETLSKRKVINVFPPERSVKYDAFINASRGMHNATISIKRVA